MWTPSLASSPDEAAPYVPPRDRIRAKQGLRDWVELGDSLASVYPTGQRPCFLLCVDECEVWSAESMLCV